MKALLLILSIILPSVSFAGGAIVQGGLDDRAILISFTSLGAGVDEEAKEDILDLVATGLGREWITTVTATKHFFEGDITYCIEFVNSTVMSQQFQSYDEIVIRGKNVKGETTPNCQ